MWNRNTITPELLWWKNSKTKHWIHQFHPLFLATYFLKVNLTTDLSYSFQSCKHFLRRSPTQILQLFFWVHSEGTCITNPSGFDFIAHNESQLVLPCPYKVQYQYHFRLNKRRTTDGISVTKIATLGFRLHAGWDVKSPEIRSSSTDWTQLSMLLLQDEAESSPLNDVFKITNRMMNNVQKVNNCTCMLTFIVWHLKLQAVISFWKTAVLCSSILTGI